MSTNRVKRGRYPFEWNWCLQQNITIQAQHIKGVHNTIADMEPRRTFFKNQWQILPSLRRPDDQIVTKVCVLASGSSSYPYGCVYLPMEEVGQAAHKSPMELNHSSIEQDHTRRENFPGDSGGAILDECSLVRSGAAVGSFGSLDTPSSSGTDNFFSNTPSTDTEELESIRVAII
ncbi:hypothetical protein, partial, partial [Parasitella parasitica]